MSSSIFGNSKMKRPNSAFSNSNGGGNGDSGGTGTPISDSGSEDIERELEQSIQKPAFTTEERFRLLDARDKLLRFRNPRVKVRVEEAIKLAGTCTDMCPEKERYMREVQRRLNPYECQEQESVVDHRLAVKEYSRSSADQEEPLFHELRPISVLHQTLDYLLHNIISRVQDPKENLENWYFFIWDRTRGIRKDITQQQLCDLDAVRLMEKCARFHIVCSSLLCEMECHAFDPKLNSENLMKCLQSLEHMYTDLTLKGIRCPNEPEFRAYQILMNLNEGDALWEIQQRPSWILKSPQVSQALKIYLAACDNNSMAFFRLVQRSSFLMSCILHRYFWQVRCKTLRAILKAHTRPNNKEIISMPLQGVKNMLGFTGPKSQAPFEEFCSSFGLFVGADQSLQIQRVNRVSPETPIMVRDYDLIESKLSTSVSESINGEPLGPNPLDTYKPFTSFDEDGFLKDEILESLIKPNKNLNGSKTGASVAGPTVPTTSSSTYPSLYEDLDEPEPEPLSFRPASVKPPVFKNTFQKIFGQQSVAPAPETSQSSPPSNTGLFGSKPNSTSFVIKSSKLSPISNSTFSIPPSTSGSPTVPKQSFGISSSPLPSSTTAATESSPIFGGPSKSSIPNIFNSGSSFTMPSQKVPAPVKPQPSGFNPFGVKSGLNTFTTPSSSQSGKSEIPNTNLFGAVTPALPPNETPQTNANSKPIFSRLGTKPTVTEYAFGVKRKTDSPVPNSASTPGSVSGIPSMFNTSFPNQQQQQQFQSPNFNMLDRKRKVSLESPNREEKISRGSDLPAQTQPNSTTNSFQTVFQVNVIKPTFQPPNQSFAPLNFAPKPMQAPAPMVVPPPKTESWPPGTQMQVSKSLENKIESEVLQELAKSIAVTELQRQKQISLVATNIGNALINSVIEEQVRSICTQSIKDRELEIENAVAKFQEVCKHLKLRSIFSQWRENARSQKEERILRLQKQKENVESFPPILTAPLSPATILSTWCGFKNSVPGRTRRSISRPNSSKSLSLGSNGEEQSSRSLSLSTTSTNEHEPEEQDNFARGGQSSQRQSGSEFPPIVSMQLSPESILRSWCGITQRKRSRSPEKSNPVANTPKRKSTSNAQSGTKSETTSSTASFLREIKELLNQVRKEKDLNAQTLMDTDGLDA